MTRPFLASLGCHKVLGHHGYRVTRYDFMNKTQYLLRLILTNTF